jgi:hypothetical protein
MLQTTKASYTIRKPYCKHCGQEAWWACGLRIGVSASEGGRHWANKIRAACRFPANSQQPMKMGVVRDIPGNSHPQPPLQQRSLALPLHSGRLLSHHHPHPPSSIVVVLHARSRQLVRCCHRLYIRRLLSLQPPWPIVSRRTAHHSRASSFAVFQELGDTNLRRTLSVYLLYRCLST